MGEKLEALQGLLERVEGASGPDRMLDADLSVACGAERNPRNSLYVRWPDGDGLFWQPPELTASLDAALALTERELPGIQWLARNQDDGSAFANLHNAGQSPNVGYPCWPAYAASPALALLSALLKAKIAGARDGR